MSVISISEFSSINFDNDWKLPFQQNVDYAPKFLPSDKIQVEYISRDDTLTPRLFNCSTGKTTELTPKLLEEDDSSKCYILTIDNSEISQDTEFRLDFVLGSGQVVARSSFFVITELPGTILLEYTNRRNVKDTIFHGIDRFAFRVEGAFLPQENTFENESEDFRDQRYVSKILSSHVYETKTLTIGGGFGVPNWVARKINVIFSASSVHVNGVPMVRSDGSAVEINLIHNDYPLYIYKIVLEESEDFGDSLLSEYLRVVDEKKKIIRRISSDLFRTYDETGGVDVNAKLIRELELLNELSEYYTLEIDDNVSGSTKKASLGTVIKLVKTHFNNNIINFGAGIVVGNPDEKHAKITKDGEVISDNISSGNFTSGALGSGHRIKDGDAEFQNLTVRGQFSVFEFLIQQVKAIGGKFCVSPASIRIGEVEELEDGYKCFFNTDGGTIANPFVVGDQAFHQVFNGKDMSRYWRLVTEVGSDYFVLSDTDCEAGSDIPQPDDEIVLLGNRTDRNRQSAIMISAYDENSPYIAYYAGINSYSFEGKEPMRTGNLNGIVDEDFGQLAGFGLFCENVYMKGVFRLMSGKTVEQAVSEVQSNIDNLQIGTENLISWKMMLEWNKKNKNIAVYGMDEDGVYLEVDQGRLGTAHSTANNDSDPIFDLKYKENTQYVISVEWKLAGVQTYSGLNIIIKYTDGTKEYVVIGKEQTTKVTQHYVSKQGKTIAYLGVTYGSALYNTLIYNISLIEGNKPLQGFPVATDDLPNNINLANDTKEGTTDTGSSDYKYHKFYMPKIKPNTAYYVSWGSAENLSGSPEEYTAYFFNKNVNASFANPNASKSGHIILTKNNFTEQEGYLLIYAGINGSTTGNSVKFTDIMLVEGRFPATAYSPSVNEQEKKIAEFEVTLDGFNSRFTSLGDSVSAIEQKTNEISLSVTAVSEESKLYAFGQSWASGKIMKGDPSFIKGMNSVSAYNNASVTREAKQPDSPISGSSYNIKVVCNEEKSGYVQAVSSRANAIFLHRFIAKLPEGYAFSVASNAVGDRAKFRWCTSDKGTGKWEEYIYVLYCGSSGSFSTFGYVYLTQAANVTWYLAYSDIFDVTNGVAPVNTGNIVNSINVSTEGIRIDANKLTISGQTLFKDSNGNSVSIFGTGDNVFTINNGVFNVDKYGKVSASSVEISGESTFGNLKINGPYLLAKDNWTLQFGANGLSQNQILLGLGQSGSVGVVAMTISHKGLGIQMNYKTEEIGNATIVSAGLGALYILCGAGNSIVSIGGCYFDLLEKNFKIKNGSVSIESSVSIAGETKLGGICQGVKLLTSAYTIKDTDYETFWIHNGSSAFDVALPANPTDGKTLMFASPNGYNFGIVRGGSKVIFGNGQTRIWAMVKNSRGLLTLIYSSSKNMWLAYESLGGSYDYGNS